MTDVHVWLPIQPTFHCIASNHILCIFFSATVVPDGYILCRQNCPFLEMVDDPEKVNACTTAFYEGQTAVMDPRESWVAKWLRVDNYLPGCYAITVTGQFDKEIEEELENRGCRWRCRPSA